MPVDTRRPMRPGPFRPNMDEPLDGIVTSNVAFEALASAAAQSPLSSSFWADFLRSSESTAYPLSPAQNVPHGDVPLYPSGNGYSTDASHGWFYMSTMVDNVAPLGPSVSASPVPSAQVAPFISNANLSPLPLENQTFTTVGYELAASVPTSSGYQTYLEQSAAADSLSDIQSFGSFQIDQFPTDQTSNIASESWLPELVPDSFANNIDSFTLPLDSRRDQTVPSHGFVLEIQTDVSIPDPTSHPVPSPSVSQATRVQSISSETPSPSTALVPTKKRKREPLDQFKATPLQDSNGALIGTFATFGNIGGRQAYSSDDRRKTAKTRQVGACQPCKRAKKRCDRPDSPYECCKNCKSRVFVMPCFLAKIVDAQLFRDKPSPGHPQSIRREVYETLSDVAIRQAQPIRVGLTQDFGIQLEVSLAPYEPQPGEITSRVWKDSNGVKHTVNLPPYCIANMQEAQERLAEYIGDFRGAFIRSTLNRCNEITRRIFDQAQRVAAFNPDSMVSQALSLCAASRIIERDWRICSHPRTLPIPFISGNPENPFNDTYPVTAMMDSQLDQIVIKNFLTPIRDRLLAQLDAAMTSPSSQTDNNSWFEIFLTLAILLSHAEWLLDHSRRNAIRMGAKTRYNYIPRAEAYFHACRIMLAHWHHLCGGSTAPLRIGMGRLQGEEKEFVEGLGMLVERRKEEMRGLKVRHRYEEELYWCHQLFFEGWEVGRLGIVDVVE